MIVVPPLSCRQKLQPRSAPTYLRRRPHGGHDAEGATLSCRRFLAASGSTAALTTFGAIAGPRSAGRLTGALLSHGIQSGDVSVDSAWSGRARPAGPHAGRGIDERGFDDILCGGYIDVLPQTDCTGKMLLEGLPAGQDIFYRIRFQNLWSPAIVGEPKIGRFRTAPADRRSVSFLWSGDQMGQGWGIDVARGGMRTYATMHRHEPDFFIHSGDNIYADCPIERRIELPDGGVLEQPRHRGEVQERRDARRVPRQLQIQPARRAPARLQRNRPGVRAMGRPRGEQRLVAGRAHSLERIPRAQLPGAGGARLPGIPRVHADARDAGRARPRVSPDRLRTAARRVHARHAQLSRAQRCAAERKLRPSAYISGPRRSPGSSIS